MALCLAWCVGFRALIRKPPLLLLSDHAFTRSCPLTSSQKATLLNKVATNVHLFCATLSF